MTPDKDIQSTSIIMIGTLASILVFVIVVAVEAFYYQAQRLEDERKMINAGWPVREELVKSQKQQLSQYQVIDPEKKVVAIPIDQAMTLVVKDYGKPSANK